MVANSVGQIFALGKYLLISKAKLTKFGQTGWHI